MSVRQQIEENPRNQGFYAAIGKGVCRMANSFASLRDAAAALEIVGEAVLQPAQAETVLVAREARALSFMIYDLTAQAEALCDEWEKIDAEARS